MSYHDTQEFINEFNKKNHPCIAKTVISFQQGSLIIVAVSMVAVAWYFANNYLSRESLDWLLLCLSILLAIIINISLIHKSIPWLASKTMDEEFLCVKDVLDESGLPSYTILLPLYHEGCIVKKTIKNINQIDYPREKLEVLVLVEISDEDTRKELKDLGLFPGSFQLVDIEDPMPGSIIKRSKPRALNCGLQKATGEIIVVFDAEDTPEPLQLKHAAWVFAKHHDIAALQAKLTLEQHEENWLVKIFHREMWYWYNAYLPYLSSKHYPIPLSGTSNHIRKSVLDKIGGWDSFNVTEDADLSIRMHKLGYKIKLLNSETTEIPPFRTWAWIRQRARWIKGLIQTTLSHSRQGMTAELWKQFVLCNSSIFMIFYFALLSITNYMICSTTLRITSGGITLVMGMVSLIVYRKCLLLYDERCFKEAKDTASYADIIYYWIMYMIANTRAAYQLLVSPYTWDKTEHAIGDDHE